MSSVSRETLSFYSERNALTKISICAHGQEPGRVAHVAAGILEGEPSSGSMAAPTSSGSSQGTRGYGGHVLADVAVPTVLGCDYHFHGLKEEEIKGQASQVISFLKTT